jgi:hypothetical protein
MKDYLAQIIAEQPNDFMKRSIAREYLQARILQMLQEQGAFLNWAFAGGTALRFLFRMPRYSEDLDFSLADAKKEHRFAHFMNKIKAAFEGEGYAADIRIRDGDAVKSAFIKFRGLLFELGISPRRDQTLSIRVETDTNPPAGATMATTIIRRFVTLNLFHHDRSSLLSGKLHAVFSRAYLKGRDLFDLAWYLAERSWPEPNFPFLNNVLSQTGWSGPEVTRENWRDLVAEKLEEIKWDQAAKDVSPFLERSQDVKLITPENFRSLLFPG